MINYFDFTQFKTNWLERKKILGDLVSAYHELFGLAQDETIWNWFEDLQMLMQQIDLDLAQDNLESKYELVMLAEVDWEKLREIKEKLIILKGLLLEVGDTGVAVTEDMVSEIIQWIELPKESANSLVNKMDSLSNDTFGQALTTLQEMVALKEEIRPYFSLLAALLLVSQPINTPDTFSVFQDKMESDILAIEGEDMVKWAPIMRYLGQAIFSYNADLTTWAINYYAQNTVSRLAFFQPVPHLFLLVLVFLFFKNFKNQDLAAQYLLVNNLAWPALLLGVPVAEKIGEQLAEEDLETDYIYRSGYYANLLLDSQQRFLCFGVEDLQAGEVIGDFVEFSQGDDLNIEKLNEFVDNFVILYKLPEDFKECLQSWLNLFLHLRECDLVDYRGELAEAGLRSWFDWEKLLKTNFGDKELKEAERYLRLIRRPVYMKVKIINVLQDLPFNDEPYLSRALAISDLYYDVYGDLYGHLVYFDEAIGEFKLNMDLPDLVNQFYQFAKGQPVELNRVLKFVPKEK
jgi:hypothetical protein